MISLKLTDGDAQAILTALSNQVDFWLEKRNSLKGKDAGPSWQLAVEQLKSWSAVADRVGEAYDRAED